MQKLVVKSDEERLVYGEVYRPMDVDSQGDAMTAESIKLMAHTFLSKGLVQNIDNSHDRIQTGCKVVESYLAKASDPDGFMEGAWVFGVKVYPDDKWEAVKTGDLNGFSFSGFTDSVIAKVVVEIPTEGSGETEKSSDGPLPAHSHTLDIVFTDGKIIGGETSEELGHTHVYNKVTATEKSFDHSHRIVLEV